MIDIPIRRAVAGWFTREAWPAIRALSIDRDDLPERHEEWLELAERRLAALAAQGLIVEKIVIGPAELQAWARENRREIDSDARVDFALWRAAQRDPKMNRGAHLPPRRLGPTGRRLRTEGAHGRR